MCNAWKKIFFLLLLLIFSMSASAYTLQFADEGKTRRLRWKNRVIPIALSKSLIAKSESDTVRAVENSLQAWEKIADVKFQIVWTEKESANSKSNFGDGVSLITIAQTPENLLLFGDDVSETAARTKIFFNRQGVIREGDIVLNPFAQFSTDGSIGTFDLEATLTHEIGHLLGLEHSGVIGSTMYIHQGKNGIYNLPAYTPRTLAQDDIAGIRALYGAKNADEDCCGSVAGKISVKNKVAENSQVWAEESETGRITAGVLTGAKGSFLLEGLPLGKYQLYAQSFTGEKSIAAVKLGEVEIQKNSTVNFSQSINPKRKNFTLEYVGFNGQVTKLAVPVSGGKSFLIYIGGENLNPPEIKIYFNSPFFKIVPDSFINHDYGTENSVISFEVEVSSKVQEGEYGFSVEHRGGQTAYFIGGLTVDKVVNP